MNATAWKWILTANCLMASSVSLAAPHSRLHHATVSATAHRHRTGAQDQSKFLYMDALPARNTRHLRPAVMMLEKNAAKQNQCAEMTGKARYHCFELQMPT